MLPLISAIILTKNEVKNIARCIKDLSFCDEILIINDNSTDGTIETVNKLNNGKIKIISHSLNNDFSQARNFGLEKVKNDWVLFVDSDERVSEALAFEISNILSNWTNKIENEYSGFYIKRFDSIWDKELKHGESGIKILRLAKKNAGKWIGKVHEKWQIKGKLGTLKNPLIHYPHQTITEFLEEINFYTNVRVEELHSKKTKTYLCLVFLYPVGKFIFNYFIKKGFLDGVNGLVFAIMMSFHSFLVRGKLWLKNNK